MDAKRRSVISAAVSKRQILLGLAVKKKSDAVHRTIYNFNHDGNHEGNKIGLK